MSMEHGARSCLAAVCVFLALTVAAVTGAETPEPATLNYKTTPQGDLALHVFAPHGEPPEGGRTAIVFFFGGGWVGGSPNQFYPQCTHLAARGLVAIAAEYRVKSRHDSTVYQSVADAKSAIRYVRSHAKDLGVNPDRIIAAGGSAGGHLAAATGTLEAFDEPGEDTAVSARPNAMILLNPVVDTTPAGYTGKALPPEGVEALSPVHHVKPGTPPTLICHGTLDKTVPHENAARFHKTMRAAGNRCELKSFDGAGHGFFNHRPETMENYTAVVAAMDAFIDALEW